MSALWVWGFGSLVHTPGFEYDARVEGYVRGWRRVWWQGSTDHRGTPEVPGRVVTLCADPNCKTWGAAFRLAGSPEHQRSTLAYLEWREKQYDLREQVDVYTRQDPDTPAVRGALCFIATDNPDSNPNYLGPAPVEAIAAQIATSHGPSGWNWEYLFKLAAVMRDMGVHDDEELFTLEALVRDRLQNQQQQQNHHQQRQQQQEEEDAQPITTLPVPELNQRPNAQQQ